MPGMERERGDIEEEKKKSEGDRREGRYRGNREIVRERE